MLMLPSLHVTPLPCTAVEGRTHSVQVHYLEAPAQHYLQAAVETVVAIHREDLPGDVLVFLTGQDECEAGKQPGNALGIVVFGMAASR